MNSLLGNREHTKSHFAPSSPDNAHVAKRQKTNGPPFRTPDRRPTTKHEDISDVTSEQMSVTEPEGSQEEASKGARNPHSGGVEEFQLVEGTPRRIRRRVNTRQVQTDGSRSQSIQFDSDEDDLAESNDLTRKSHTRNLQSAVFTPRAQDHMNRASGRRDSAGDGADEQFRQTHEHRKRKKARLGRPSATDGSPDPLQSDTPGTRSKGEEPVRKPTPPSLSSRGDMRQTFPGSSRKNLVKGPFLIKSALCAPDYKYLPPEVDGKEVSCILTPNDDGAGLAARSADGGDECPPVWLNIDVSKLQRLHTHTESAFIKIARSSNIANREGSALMLECTDASMAASLVAWLASRVKFTPIRETRHVSLL